MGEPTRVLFWEQVFVNNMLYSSRTLRQKYFLLINYIVRSLKAEYFEEDNFSLGPLDDPLEKLFWGLMRYYGLTFLSGTYLKKLVRNKGHWSGKLVSVPRVIKTHWMNLSRNYFEDSWDTTVFNFEMEYILSKKSCQAQGGSSIIGWIHHKSSISRIYTI